ncbi:kinase-like protein [Leucogyrophana mollusca]|uniref:Kinase-like protein n=1 Tax=Leucogyrophana mollusca TaxID=85980 RepID=A0ACB8BUJ4_9AGAM|nr:kinase-like protein [Leucogyrophana mollusca]
MFALSGEPAQAMVDLLQALTDAHVPELDEWYRRRFLDALIRLSRKSALYPGSLVLHDVTILSDDPLYSGSFGAVYKAKIQDRLVAVKKLKAGDKELAEILKVQFLFTWSRSATTIVWRHLRHPNCLPFYGVYRADGDSCMISPWMENASLTIYLRKNPGADRSFLILDVARGLEYLHTSQPTVVHGDLKGANILITASGRACLADFGLATTSISQAILPSSTQLRSKGTLNYCGPELLGADPDTIRALDQRRCDMYSFGCICYEIYTGNYPFYGMADVYQQKLLGRTPARPTGPEYDARGLDDDMWGFVVNLWSRNPEARATAEQAVRWLEAEGRSGGRQEVFGEDGAWDVRFLAGLTSPTVGYPFAPAV